METETTSLTIRLPQKMRDTIREIALGEDLTVSQFIRRHLSATLGKTKKTRKKGGVPA